ncbi:FecR family protein [Chitinophaga agrisoli]|uniref:FecR family protein n=1 Tax=Chitinophaga agrisoli TaxID=2607653 RepID=A0A5B2VWG3_9BACT|nr:FecR family protein [Chitinophaga agrisoli]KAA2242597.1 FecR family protein [Chitinophaga agrisoli]
MTPEEYISLFEKYQDGLCTPEEEALVLSHRDRFRLLEQELPELPEIGADVGSRIFDRITQTTAQAKIRRFNWWWAAAAVLGLLIGLGVVLRKPQAEKPLAAQQKTTATPDKRPIKPGANVATLTLANGKVITLNDAPEGVLAQTDNSAITNGNGGLAYAANGNGRPVTNALNTMTVPRGGQYTVTLADGTRVWLNSQSSLTYPEVFTGPERKVKLQGEAYFEISQNVQQPFTVEAEHATVHVLGTAFNISAYADESTIRTTLVTGSVRLSGADASAILTPGEQGVITPGHPGIQEKQVNIARETAWKAGYFVFRNSTIQDIMRQVSRWYDIEIAYSGTPPTGTFGGTYSKNKDIQELLKGLELTGLVHFKIEGRKLIVL